MAVGKSDLFCWRSHRRCNQWWIFRIRCRGGFVISWTFPERSMARSIFGFYCNSRTFFFFNKPAANSLGIWPCSVRSFRPLILRFCCFICPSRSRHLPSSGMFHLRFQICNTVCCAWCWLLRSIQCLSLWLSLGLKCCDTRNVRNLFIYLVTNVSFHRI